MVRSSWTGPGFVPTIRTFLQNTERNDDIRRHSTSVTRDHDNERPITSRFRRRQDETVRSRYDKRHRGGDVGGYRGLGRTAGPATPPSDCLLR